MPTRLLDRRIVHKRAAAEVLLLGCDSTGPDRWVLPFEIPRGHYANNLPHSAEVPMLLGLELVRQSGIVMSHLGEKVPIDWKFLMQRISFAWVESAPSYPEHRPFRGMVDIQVTRRRVRREIVSGLVADVVVSQGNEILAYGAGDIDFIPARTYRALRRNSVGLLRSPAGSSLLIDVSMNAHELRARVGIDSADPFLFDHPVDHIPGMLLAKAALAAHERLAGARLCKSIELDSVRFAEHGEQLTMHTMKSSAATTLTIFHQEGYEIARATCV